MTQKQNLGALGEKAAAEYLESLGYKILIKNWRCRFGEVDIVATEGDQTVFVEVKTRSGSGFGHPFEAITAAKVRSMSKTANAYCFAHRVGTSIRLDAIAVYLSGGQTSVEHLKQVFR